MTGSLKKASESLISTISSAISVSSSGSRAPSYDSSYKYQSYRYRSLSSGSNTLKLMLGDTVFLDVSSIDADSPDNQLVRYAEEHVYCGKKSTSGSVMESLFKPRNALSDVEYRLAPKNVCSTCSYPNHVSHIS